MPRYAAYSRRLEVFLSILEAQASRRAAVAQTAAKSDVFYWAQGSQFGCVWVRRGARVWEAWVMPSRLRFLFSQLGRKPGASEVLQQLLSVEDLDSDRWRRLDERTWRTGSQAGDQAWARRAAATGSITGWRSFKAAGRGLWIQISPMASSDDARAALGQAPGLLLKNLRSTVTITESVDAEAPAIPGASDAWAHEQRTTGRDGSGTSLLLAFVRGNSLVAAGVGGTPPWQWKEFADIMTAQALKIAH